MPANPLLKQTKLVFLTPPIRNSLCGVCTLRLITCLNNDLELDVGNTGAAIVREVGELVEGTNDLDLTCLCRARHHVD